MVLLVVLLVCHIVSGANDLWHYWCYWCSMVLLVVLLVSCILSGVVVGPLHCSCSCWFIALLVLMLLHHATRYSLIILSQWFFVLLVVTPIVLMCYDEILPPSPLPCRWCIGGLSHCCLIFIVRYPPLPFPFMLFVLLIFHHVVRVVIIMFHVP